MTKNPTVGGGLGGEVGVGICSGVAVLKKRFFNA